MAVKKVLFDLPTKRGSARPDFLIALLDERTGVEMKIPLQILQSNDPDYLALRRAEQDHLEEIGPVLSMTIDQAGAGAITEAMKQMLQ